MGAAGAGVGCELPELVLLSAIVDTPLSKNLSTANNLNYFLGPLCPLSMGCVPRPAGGFFVLPKVLSRIVPYLLGAIP